MNIVDDNSEFGQLIQDVVHGRRPAYIEGTRVFLTNGVPLKNHGKILVEIFWEPERNDPCPCPCESGKKYKKCCRNLVDKQNHS